jgi:hypothetical protein
MTKTNSHSKYSSNVSIDSAVKIAEIVDNLNFETGEIIGSESIINQIKFFFNTQFNVTSLVQIQSYCATTNDHTALSTLNENLTSLIKYSNTVPELHQSIKPLITELISTHNIKVFYRCLTNEHSTIANPALKLLTEIVSFNNGYFVDEFLEHFDLTLKSLADLFFPTKTSVRLSKQGKSHLTIRHFMSIFWITLCSNALPLTRNDLLVNNKKITNNWFKFINEFDNVEIINKNLKFIEEKILNEKSFRKMTKCKILGGFILGKIVDLYKIHDVKEDVHKLLLKITTDEENGLLFHDYRSFFNEIPLNILPSNISFNNSGVPINIGENKFKINNKLVYNILTSLHPWADSLHLKLIISVLKVAPELSAPYTTYLFHINGSHDPKLTSFYIGQTLLLTKIIQLPIPLDFIQMSKKFIENSDSIKKGSYFSSKILMEIICPAALNRSSITKGLNATQPLIRHLTAQLVVSILQKYSKVQKLLNFNENSVLASLRNELQESLINLKLPDSTVFIGITNECLKSENVNKLLLLNYMKCVEYYYSVLDINIPLQLGSINKIIGIQLGEENSINNKLSALDILLFNSYLTLTANYSLSNQQNKWWNISKGSKNTLFTTFAKLPYDLQYEENEKKKIVDNALIVKVVEVLSNFIDDTLAFEDYKLSNTNVKNSQAWAIVLSLLKTFNGINENVNEIIESICKILDESISRSIRTPYKYFDIVSKTIDGLDSKNANRLSVFYVALCEQSKFAKQEHQKYVNEWIKHFSTYLFLLGEPLELMTMILKEYCNIEMEFNENTYEKYLNNNNLLEFETTNFSIISFTPIANLKQKINTTIPKLDVEIIAILNRLETIVNFDIEFEKIEELILDLVSAYGNYLIQKYSSLLNDEVNSNNVQLLDSKFWSKFFINFDHDTNENQITKKYFIMSLLNEIFKELWELPTNSNFKDSLPDIIGNLINSNKLSSVAIKRVSEFIWVLSDDQVKQLIGTNVYPELYESLFEVAIKRNLKLGSDLIVSFCKNNDYELDFESIQKFKKLTESAVFHDEQVLEIVGLTKSSKNLILCFSILENYCLQDSNNVEKISNLFVDNFNMFLENIEGFKFLQFLSIQHKQLRSELFNFSIGKIDKMIQSDKFDISLNTYLYSISLFIQENDITTEIQNKIENLISIDAIRNFARFIFSPELTSIIFILYGKNLESKVLKTWLYRATLYITKVFAERVENELDSEFIAFLKCLQNSLNISIWKYVSKDMLNSQLDVIFGRLWIQDINVLKYCLWIVETGSKNVIECVKLVNILLNNNHNLLIKHSNNEEAKYYLALIFKKLIEMNIKQLSSYEILFKIIKMYKCTTRASDLVLKSLLINIEIEIGESWIQFVSNWDLIDEWFPEKIGDSIEVSNFVIDTPGISDSLTINLNKIIIKNTVEKFDPSLRNISIPVLEEGIKCQKKNLFKLDEFYEFKKIDNIEIEGDVIYDIEFLLLLIVNNEDLFKINEDSVHVNINALINTSLLQLVICGLAHESIEIHEISKRIISSILITIEEDIKQIQQMKENKETNENISFNSNIISFKERSAFKVYLGNLLYLFEVKNNAKLNDESVEPIPKIFIIMLSNLVPILANPGHFLYEKAYRYILGGSKYRDFEIPMYKIIMNKFVKDEHTKSGENNNDDIDYYKQLQWIIQNLSKSITSNEDLKILRRNEVIEQLLSLSNSPYLSSSMEGNILQVFERIIRLENGADLMTRSFGMLSFIEGKKNIIDVVKQGEIWNKYNKLALKTIISSDCQNKDKRGREWSNDDFKNIIKRICM